MRRFLSGGGARRVVFAESTVMAQLGGGLCPMKHDSVINRTPRGPNEQAGNHRSHRQIRRHFEGGRGSLARRGRYRNQDGDEERQHGYLGRFRNVLRRPARGAHRAQSANRYGNQDQGGKSSQIPSWKSPEGCSKLAALPGPARRSAMASGFL